MGIVGVCGLVLVLVVLMLLGAGNARRITELNNRVKGLEAKVDNLLTSTKEEDVGHY